MVPNLASKFTPDRCNGIKEGGGHPSSATSIKLQSIFSRGGLTQQECY